MATYTTNYNLEKPDASDPFGDFRQSYNDNMDIIDQNLGGGGGGGHTIVDPNGTDLPQEAKLQFTGTVSVTDDSVNGATVVDIIGGGNGLILNADIYSTEEQVVGVWTNKKPLYQKTIISDVSQSTGSISIATGISDIDEIANFNGSWSYGTNSSWIPLPFSDDSNQTSISNSIVKIRNIRKSDGVLTLYIGNDYTGTYAVNKIRVTLQYTKTTDTAGSGGFQAYGFSPIIYSDVERVVGVWRDNKPLYQKTAHISNISILANSSTNVNISDYFSDVDSAVDYECCDENGNAIFPNIMVNSGLSPYSIGVTVDKSSDHIVFTRGNGSNATISVRFTLRYTKTTDVAGSGDYTTLGIPTVHYDGNEKVIGTYFGATLYEKTIKVASVTSGNNDIAHGIANVDKVIDSKATFFSTANNSTPIPNGSLSPSWVLNLTDTGTTTFRLSIGSSWVSYCNGIDVTLQYTKTS